MPRSTEATEQQGGGQDVRDPATDDRTNKTHGGQGQSIVRPIGEKQQRILELLGDGPKDLPTLATAMDREPADVSSSLGGLVSRGYVKRLKGEGVWKLTTKGEKQV